MALLVSILAQKGGTRKTTLARALAVAYTTAGWQTLLADMDTNQATATDWNERRTDRGIAPAIDVRQFRQLAQLEAVRDEFDIVLADGKAYASVETAALAKVSDLILIPTGTSLDDLKPSVVLAQLLLSEHGIDPAKILFPITNMGKSQAEVTATQEYLATAGFQASPGHLSIMTTFSQAHDSGRAVTEVAPRGPKKQANDWIRGIIHRIDQLAA